VDTTDIVLAIAVSRQTELGGALKDQQIVVIVAVVVVVELVELLAVVYAFQKFRIYVVGHPTTLYSDNKALSFLKKCKPTSARVTRRIMQLQDYDPTIQHISGTSNFFADILSRNPIGLDSKSMEKLKKQREFMVAKIDLRVNKSLLREIKDLSTHQVSDPLLAKIRGNYERDPSKYEGKYMYEG
jgi:hypothetical protein